MTDNIIQDKSLDYANKVLPNIPEDYTVEDASSDEAVIVNNQ